MSCISNLLFTYIPCLCDIKFYKQTKKRSASWIPTGNEGMYATFSTVLQHEGVRLSSKCIKSRGCLRSFHVDYTSTSEYEGYSLIIMISTENAAICCALYT